MNSTRCSGVYTLYLICMRSWTAEAYNGITMSTHHLGAAFIPQHLSELIETNLCVPDIYVDKRNPPNQKQLNQKDTKGFWGEKKFPMVVVVVVI